MRGKTIVFLLLMLALTLQVSAIEAFRVTAVTADVAEHEYSGPCPHRFEFSGRITVNRAGTVRYRWIRSDGGKGSEETLAFATAGTKPVSSYWQLGAGMGNYPDRWMAIEILAPNSLFSRHARFSLKCIPLVMAPVYEISGLIDSGAQGNLIAGRQVKVIVRRSGAPTLFQTITLDAGGRGSYRFSRTLGRGRYQVLVERLPYTGSSTLSVCYEGTVPENRWVELSETCMRVLNQDFTVQFVIGWDRREPCW